MSGLVRRWSIRLLRVVVIAYLIVLALLFAFQRQLLFPAGGPPPSLERAGLADLMEPVKIATADGLFLLSWYHRPEKSDAPFIILFHGNGGTIEYRAAKARVYIGAGFGLLLLEYRGYGGNPGSPSEEGLYADGRAALAFAAALGIAPNRVILMGESLGTGVAVQMAIEQRVAALVLEAPYSSVPDVAQSHFPYFPVRWLVRDRFDSEQKIARVGVPVFVIQGEQDRTIPVRFGQKLFAAAAQPKEAKWVAGTGHDLLGRPMADAAAVDFLKRNGLAP